MNRNRLATKSLDAFVWATDTANRIHTGEKAPVILIAPIRHRRHVAWRRGRLKRDHREASLEHSTVL